MVNQFDALNEELQRRRDECIQLKTILVAKHRMSMMTKTQTSSTDMMMSGHTDSDDTNADINSINTEGNEFEVGYNTQKILNRILENQMNEQKRNSDEEKTMLMKEIKQLRDETERQQDLLMQNLSPELLADATFKNEIIKLTDQNLVSLISIHRQFNSNSSKRQR